MESEESNSNNKIQAVFIAGVFMALAFIYTNSFILSFVGGIAAYWGYNKTHDRGEAERVQDTQV